MRNSTLIFAALLTFVGTPVAMFAQDVHQEIQKMERARFLRMEERFISRLAKTGQSDFDVRYYRIHLIINPLKEMISGDVTVAAVSAVSGLKGITLDLYDNMVVDSVLSEDRSLLSTHANDELAVELAREYEIGQSFSVSIYYHGSPADTGGLPAFTFGYHGDVPIISTLSEPFGAPSWWPCKDDPADKADSVDIIITVPETLIVASNGTLIADTTDGDGGRTFFWAERYPITTYLVSLAISNYQIFSDSYHYSDTDSMEVQFFVYPEDFQDAEEDFSVTVPMIAYYSSVFGEYPFLKEKYGMAEFPWGGAMEHQTCTSYGAGLIRGDHYYDRIVAHELAHQWFGDLITMKYWPHIWLNEGFASYAEALWRENVGGKDAYLDYMQGFDEGLFPTSVFVRDSTNIHALFSRTVYDKGAWVLHMLRHIMGDVAFFGALKHYGEVYAYRNATTEDFRNVCELYYGDDLNWFFRKWVYGWYRPKYEYAWYNSATERGETVTLILNQTQTNTGPFKMPLDIVLTTTSAETTIVVWDSSKVQTFEFALNKEVIDLAVDPEGWVLKEIRHVAGTGTESNLPEAFSLSQNYPNPFNLLTTLRYDLPERTYVNLVVYDVLGREVRTLVDRMEESGYRSVTWDGTDNAGKSVGAGVYVYQIKAGDFSKTYKMVFLK